MIGCSSIPMISICFSRARPTCYTLFPYTTLFRSALADAIALARATVRKIRQNLFFAFAYNVLGIRSEEHTSELQLLRHIVCRLLLEKKKRKCLSDIATGKVPDVIRDWAEDCSC